MKASFPPSQGVNGLRPDAFYRGEIALLNATSTTGLLVQGMHSRLQQALFPAPIFATAQHILANDLLRGRLHHLRRQLYTDQVILKVLATIVTELATELKWPELPFVDLPRLRAIVPQMHQLSAATDAFSAHRDTWYANPPAQINLWIPLGDYPATQTFVFYPDCFSRAVKNNSESFDYEHWRATVGWQSLQKPESAIYPQALELQVEEPLGFACEAGQRLLFSGSHLHQPLPNNGENIRFSLDLRLVCRSDFIQKRGTPQTDNRSQGSTWPEFVSLAAWQ
ncbi:MAG: hypothetical protein IV090_18380 [Candidatus Sericytochromatia bacterium]|nr:hypothetical protein [Candidatus Sericytochromatia bacterium]